MTSDQRSIAGRIGAIGIVTTLFLVGLAAPALALPPTPGITSFAPPSGPVGTSVTITGTDLGSATDVSFNGVSAPMPLPTNTAISIVAVVPATATTGKITVTTAGGTSPASATNFTVTPAVTSFLPTSGPVGTSVTITGTTLSSATSVKFNGVSATTTSSNTATQIVAVVPAGATTGKVSVTTAAGTGTSAANFTITPGITSFSPTSGLVGTSVTITGTDLGSATSVKFNGTVATVTSNTAIQIVAVVPAAATTGKVSVTTAAGTGTSLTNFTVLPGITSFAPSKGPIGASVTINGTTLGGATSVKFNGTPATISSNTATQIVAVVPAGASTGAISVTTTSGTATTTTPFTVTHGRSVSLQLKNHLVARGDIHVADGTAACASHMQVKIQKKVHGNWRTIKTKSTNGSGSYKTNLPDESGKYRALAPKDMLASGDICGKAISTVKSHG